jgi:acyl-CoA reductase-like NAD-dependent aldehyde dehydrogenase
MIIDGQQIRTGRQIDVINPATGAVFASAARADQAVLDAAVAAAQRAFPAWSAIPLPDRAALMHKLADSPQERADEFARLIVMEQGKPLAEAQMEASTGIGLLRYIQTSAR